MLSSRLLITLVGLGVISGIGMGRLFKSPAAPSDSWQELGKAPAGAFRTFNLPLSNPSTKEVTFHLTAGCGVNLRQTDVTVQPGEIETASGEVLLPGSAGDAKFWIDKSIGGKSAGRMWLHAEATGNTAHSPNQTLPSVLTGQKLHQSIRMPVPAGWTRDTVWLEVNGKRTAPELFGADSLKVVYEATSSLRPGKGSLSVRVGSRNAPGVEFRRTLGYQVRTRFPVHPVNANFGQDPLSGELVRVDVKGLPRGANVVECPPWLSAEIVGTAVVVRFGRTTSHGLLTDDVVVATQDVREPLVRIPVFALISS